MWVGIAARLCARARFALWIRSRNACWIWTGQYACGVGLLGVFAVSDQVLDAQLVDQVREDFAVVVLVPVVDHHAGQVGQHERLEGGQAAIAEQVPGVQVGAGDQQILLHLAWADPDRGLVAGHHMREGDQRADHLVGLGHRGRGPADQRVDEPAGSVSAATRPAQRATGTAWATIR